MHEMSLVQSLVETALAQAGRTGAGRIVRVHLLVGQFSDENEGSIRMYWREFAQGTPAQDAELVFETVPARIECLACGQAFEFDRKAAECPACHSSHVRVASGEEVELGRIETE
jgi:hydrogenase nickel incorporation protein HypA/HybF